MSVMGGTNYGNIGGALPSGAGNGTYGSDYQSALGYNQANYNNILAGYGQTMQSQQQAQNQVNQGWTGLQNQVAGLLSTQGQSQAQQIQNQYTASAGQLNQQMTDRGLGNTTVQDAVQRGNQQSQELALNNNSQNYAGLMANSMSQLGVGGLNQLSNAYQQNTGLAQNQLNWMNSVNAPYPNQANYQTRGGMAAGGGGNRGAAAGLGYMPTAAPGGYDSGTAPSYGYSGSGGAYGAPAASGGSNWNTVNPAYTQGGGGQTGMIGTAMAAYNQGISNMYGNDGVDLGDYGGGGDFGGDFGGGGDY